jgi:hypothetical protein
MQTSARLVTGAYESDDEWSFDGLRALAPFGVDLIQPINAAGVADRLRTLATPHGWCLTSEETRLRSAVFKNATNEFVDLCLTDSV